MAAEPGAMEIDGGLNTILPHQLQPQPQPQPQPQQQYHHRESIASSLVLPPPANPQSQPVIREMYRQLPVRVHVRRPGRDTWMYVGRATVSHEVAGQTSRVVVRTTPDKVLTTFGEVSENYHCDLQAERRGNFVVVACIESEGVLSWSLNAVNMADTLRLLASIELACYKSKQYFTDPKRYTSSRRKIERVIRDDRRKRHRRKRDEEDMINAFGQQKLA